MPPRKKAHDTKGNKQRNVAVAVVKGTWCGLNEHWTATVNWHNYKTDAHAATSIIMSMGCFMLELGACPGHGAEAGDATV